MSITEYKNRLMEEVEDLPEDKLKFIIDFVEYIKDKEAWAATRDILEDTDLMRDVVESKRDLKEGRKEEFRDWDEIR